MKGTKNAVIEPDTVDVDFIKNLRTMLKLDQETFAHLLGVRVRTVSRWETEESNPDDLATVKLIRLNEIANMLLKIMSPSGASNWLQRPLNELEGVAPLDLLGSEYAMKALKRLIRQAVEGAST